MKRATATASAADDRKWDALQRRDRGADGSFFYAVRTTGVYCRPSCPSRLPRRANVLFFGSNAAAERAGYRACKKCRPKMEGSAGAAHAVVRACRLLEAAEDPPSLNDLAAAVGLSPFYLHRLFKKEVGVTPKAYAAARRVQRFRDRLREGQSVTRALYSAGYGSSSRCYESAADHLGMTPAEYRNGGAGQRVRFATATCDLGRVLVAATERGICAIEFGESDAALRASLATRLPEAELRGDNPAFRAWVVKVLAFLECPGLGLDLPLDVRGTAFQQRVWQALRAVPAGTTATYTEIAERIGQPTAARAVAQACAANPVAVAIPCHRVVRAGGTLGGYRWGMDRKRTLLARESSASLDS